LQSRVSVPLQLPHHLRQTLSLRRCRPKVIGHLLLNSRDERDDFGNLSFFLICYFGPDRIGDTRLLVASDVVEVSAHLIGDPLQIRHLKPLQLLVSGQPTHDIPLGLLF
jgi:hypothetical protein